MAAEPDEAAAVVAARVRAAQEKVAAREFGKTTEEIGPAGKAMQKRASLNALNAAGEAPSGPEQVVDPTALVLHHMATPNELTAAFRAPAVPAWLSVHIPNIDSELNSARQTEEQQVRILPTEIQNFLVRIFVGWQ